MTTYKNFIELQKGLNQKITKALNEVGEKVWEELYLYIEQEIYMKNTLRLSVDSGYERTYQFLDSLRKTSTVRSGASFKYIIDFDIDKIKPELRNDSLFNAHMSIGGNSNCNGASISGWMPTFMDQGIDSPYYYHDGIQFMDFIRKYLSNNYNRLMLNELKRIGIVIK